MPDARLDVEGAAMLGTGRSSGRLAERRTLALSREEWIFRRAKPAGVGVAARDRLARRPQLVAAREGIDAHEIIAGDHRHDLAEIEHAASPASHAFVEAIGCLALPILSQQPVNLGCERAVR